jgi:hypothetical protein
MVWIWIIMGVVVGIFVFRLANARRGVNYWKRCEIEYTNSVSGGCSAEEALLEISIKRHPELLIGTHKTIIDKFNNVPLLVNFFEGALPDTKLDDEIALEIMMDTTIQYLGPDRYKVRTKRAK